MEGDLGKWYAVQVTSGREAEVSADILEKSKEHGFSQDVLDVFYPEETVFQTRRGERVSKKVCLYQGYLFVKMVYSPGLVSVIRSVPGVLGLMDGGSGAGGFMEDHEIEQMRESQGRLAREEEVSSGADGFGIGEEVQITSGCFENTTGVIRAFKGDHVSIEVILFGDNVTFLDVPIWSVKAFKKEI